MKVFTSLVSAGLIEDVIAAGGTFISHTFDPHGTTAEACYNHFQMFGINEGYFSRQSFSQMAFGWAPMVAVVNLRTGEITATWIAQTSDAMIEQILELVQEAEEG